MQTVSIVLSVYYDGQFYSAVFEARDEQGCRAARIVFAAPPTDPEILELVLREWNTLHFSKAMPGDEALCPGARNPKRRQREAADAQRQALPSTRAQAALKAQQEINGAVAKRRNTEWKREREQAQFELRARKKKEKHKGH